MPIAVPGAHVTVKSTALPSDPLWVTTGDFETDWALVDNTAVAKARSADVAALKVHFVGMRPTDATLAAAIKGLPLDPAELDLLGEIDAELRLRGLRFHHVFFAMPRTTELTELVSKVAGSKKMSANEPDTVIASAPLPPKAPGEPVAAALWYRLKYLDASGTELQRTSAPELKQAEERLERAKREEEAISKAIAELDVSTREKLLSGLGCDATMSDLEDKRLEVKERERWAARLKTTGSFYSFGGDNSFAGADGSTKKLGGTKLSDIVPVDEYIRSRLSVLVTTLKDAALKEEYKDDVAEEYVKMSIITFARYLDREGRPNSVATSDGTFTLGSGFNTYGGAGVDLLDDLAQPKKRVKDVDNQEALRLARDFLLRCGIAVSKSLPGPTGASPNVRVLHFEGDRAYVLLTLSGAPTPPLPVYPPAPRAPTTTNVERYKIALANYKEELRVWTLDKANIDLLNAYAERLQALEYVRRKPALLSAFVRLGSTERPPDAPTTVKPYQVVSALLEVGFLKFVTASTADKFPLWYLVRAGGPASGTVPSGTVPSGTAAFTFLHHISWWGYGGLPNVLHAMRWAISRGYVKTRVFLPHDEVGEVEQKIELKAGAGYMTKDGDKVLYAQAVDDDGTDALRGEASPATLRRLVVDDSLATPVGLVKGVFTYVERTHGLATRSDPTMWSILCKLWVNFLSDLKEERSVTTIPARVIPLPTEVPYVDAKGKAHTEAVTSPPYLRDGHHYVKGRHGTEIEVPSGVRFDAKGRVLTTTTTTRSGAIASAEEQTDQERIVASLNGACDVFPYETLEEFRSRWEGQLVDETPTLYAMPDGATEATFKTLGKTKTPLSATTYRQLQRHVDWIVDMYTQVSLSKSSAELAKAYSKENTDALRYLSDLAEGNYVVCTRRDAQEIDVGRPEKEWSEIYRLRELKVGSIADPSKSP